mmetsp:Transcript_12211/g.22643  ORF Transcript_12211/g.22643 Transcript_12211/m.22643 type:complete len:776 (-) Transcript_12211:131-2458(-)
MEGEAQASGGEPPAQQQQVQREQQQQQQRPLQDYHPQTPPEKEYYAKLVGLINPAGSELFMPQKVSELLSHAGLDKKQLQDIWATATGNQPEVRKPQVFTMLRCVALAQHQKPFDLEARAITNGETLFPRFAGIQPPHIPKAEAMSSGHLHASSLKDPTGQNFVQLTNSSPRETDNRRVSVSKTLHPVAPTQRQVAVDWSIPGDLKAHYDAIFVKQSNGRELLPGKEAAQFFRSSPLKPELLRRIWDLSDTDRDGSLTRGEFCIAMHLITLASRYNAPLPNQLPPELLSVARPSDPNERTGEASPAPTVHTASSVPPRFQRTNSTSSSVGGPSTIQTGLFSASRPASPASVPGTTPLSASSAPGFAATPPPQQSRQQLAAVSALVPEMATANQALAAAQGQIGAVSDTLRVEQARVSNVISELRFERERLMASLQSNASVINNGRNAINALAAEQEALKAEVHLMRQQVEAQWQEMSAIARQEGMLEAGNQALSLELGHHRENLARRTGMQQGGAPQAQQGIAPAPKDEVSPNLIEQFTATDSDSTSVSQQVQVATDVLETQDQLQAGQVAGKSQQFPIQQVDQAQVELQNENESQEQNSSKGQITSQDQVGLHEQSHFQEQIGSQDQVGSRERISSQEQSNLQEQSSSQGGIDFQLQSKQQKPCELLQATCEGGDAAVSSTNGEEGSPTQLPYIEAQASVNELNVNPSVETSVPSVPSEQQSLDPAPGEPSPVHTPPSSPEPVPANHTTQEATAVLGSGNANVAPQPPVTSSQA